MPSFVKGDLVFVPSQVTLLQFESSPYHRGDAPNKWIKTEKPSLAVVEADLDPYCKILYKGQYWFVNENSIMECE